MYKWPTVYVHVCVQVCVHVCVHVFVHVHVHVSVLFGSTVGMMKKRLTFVRFFSQGI